MSRPTPPPLWPREAFARASGTSRRPGHASLREVLTLLLSPDGTPPARTACNASLDARSTTNPPAHPPYGL